MLALLLLAHPRALLPIGHDLESETAQPESDTEDVGCAHAGGECRRRDGIQSDGGEADERAPGCLCHPSDQEFGRGLLDFVKAGVVALGEDSLEEVRSH